MEEFLNSVGYKTIENWLFKNNRKPFLFQQQTWCAINEKLSGIVNAPTGFGKTYSVFLGTVIKFINENPTTYKNKTKQNVQLIWITPLRALATDIGKAMEGALAELEIPWQVGVRNGDTSNADRAKQKAKPPEILIITPESLHLLLAQKNHFEFFKDLKLIAVDEWHELIGGKRGVMVELAIAYLTNIVTQNQLQIWGISATIGNLKQASEVLLFSLQNKNYTLIKANLPKQIDIHAIYPDELEKFPWAGHLGTKLVNRVIEIIEEKNTTLVFINTRGMSEIWYQAILNEAPHLAGAIALHHSSMEREIRTWVENALHENKLKAVVCTASLDLGVDFRPVDTVIQVGSPKGISRFIQRAGRSGHEPGKPSTIYFLPTHSLELLEIAAIKQAIDEQNIENKEPLFLCFDVLIQFLGTIACGTGFIKENIFKAIKSTYCYSEINEQEWQSVLDFLITGGKTFNAYDEYKKIIVSDDGLHKMANRRLAMRHRMHIGTIVSDAMLKVKLMSGGFLGVIEEFFISKLQPGDCFVLAGKVLELVQIKDMFVYVKKSNSKKSILPSWMGGRMSLSNNLGFMLRKKLQEAEAVLDYDDVETDEEINFLKPLFELQNTVSKVPKTNELLIELIETKDGYHLFAYPFEGRFVHEAMGMILAHRISKLTPISFSIAMNDYGFELLSDQPIPIDENNIYSLFSLDNLYEDIQASVNETEMAKRKFRDIAVIGGLVFQGYPGEMKKQRHLQSSTSLLYNVLCEFDSNNVLLQQARQEVMNQQMEEQRLRDTLKRVLSGKIIIKRIDKLTPFCFPIKVDSIRENLSSEQLEHRVKKMINANN